MGVVAQWQSAGGLSQRPWVRFPVAPLSLEPFAVSKVLRTVMVQTVSLIRHNHYRSLDHRGVLSIGLLPAVICS